MSSQSPQRARKLQGHPGTAGQPPREMSPSPSLRDRQRTIKGQSVPSAMQMYSNSNPPPSQRQGQQPSPTISNASHQSKRSPPPTSQISPSKLSSPPRSSNARDLSPERTTPPPPPTHSHSQSNLHQPAQPPPLQQHSFSQPNIHSSSPQGPQIGYPRPINRIPPPQFLLEKNWVLTPELMADIERADYQQTQGAHLSNPAAAGMAGVAYAGGASSSNLSYSRNDSGSPPRDPGMERVRASERSSPKDIDSGHGSGGSASRRRDTQAARESPQNRERSQTIGSTVSSASYASQGSAHTPERRGSPQYHTPLGTPGENPTAYIQYKRESYQASQGSLPPPRITTPPILRRGSNASNAETIRMTPPAGNKHSSQTPPLHAMKTRTPDRSLPVQEEPEDDATHAKNGSHEPESERWNGREQSRGSPTPSSDLHPDGHGTRYDTDRDHDGRDSRVGHRDEDDDETLIEQESEDLGHHSRDRDEDDGGHTPRSPTADLPEDPRDRLYIPQNIASRPSIPLKHRNGSMDQLGLRGFDPATFEMSNNGSKADASGQRSSDMDPPRHYVPPPQPRYQVSKQESDPHGIDQQAHRGRYYQQVPPPPPLDDLQSFLEDPASAYIQAYLQSPRPNAPIPPTPHSQTAAPSPSPLISAMQSDAGSKDLPPTVGSPYPFPFAHVRRTHTYSGHPNHPPPSSNYDPNHPSAIQEQLALQMQMYALNNHAPLSDSTFSPSSTPFPAPGYNPWAFMQARLLGTRQRDPTMSLQSSPSHEPIPLPLPPLRGRGLKKRERSSNLREEKTARQKQPPPRVESTQPRETSPEFSSSGEETAGEEKFEVSEEGNWVNGVVPDDNSDWVDEDDEGEDEDLLELEYHPSFVSNVEKRRRRWETKWEALIQAFQAVDRQTDATLVLLASPSHSTKLHSLTSRSIRRDANLANSPPMSNIRSSFRQVASRRRAARSRKSSLADRLLTFAGSSGDGSDGSSESREEDLKRALEAALGSLGAVGDLYQQREARWREEMRRVTEDREQVELLLRQALGSGLLNGNGVGRAL